MEKGASIKVGCCGFAEGRKSYFFCFPVVEVQQTFYKPPLLATARRWREEAPPDFEFTIKAWQLITHPSRSPTYRKAGLKVLPGKETSYGYFRLTEEVMAAWETTSAIAEALRARIILFQCPSSFADTWESAENLRAFFRGVKRGTFVFVWEPRGDWKEESILRLCQELDLIHGVDPFEKKPLTGGIRYFRLHGGPGYRHVYTDAELLRLREMALGEETYCLFNNLAMGQDARRFLELLAGKGNANEQGPG